jgi:hypothetical protein
MCYGLCKYENCNGECHFKHGKYPKDSACVLENEIDNEITN